jgi:hypothetical protein
MKNSMNISASHLLQYVIKPTLESLEMHSSAAEKLLLGTAAQESDFNPFKNNTQGLGIYQISSEQHRAAWDSYLAFHPDLASKVRGLASQHKFLQNPDAELLTNLAYSTAIAFIIYLQCEVQLPEANDADGLGHFWQQNFCHSSVCQTESFARWIRENGAAA